MPISIDHSSSAQIALGKFFLHPWDSQVLVDWAYAAVQQGFDEEEVQVLSDMEGEEREEILSQFRVVAVVNGLTVDFAEVPAITAYLENLRKRVLTNQIEPRAAFAQVRPLSYDLEGLQLSGLSELDEDLNLLDSNQPAFHNQSLTAGKEEFFIRTFFRSFEVLAPLPDPADAPWDDELWDEMIAESDEEKMMRYLESFSLALVIALVLLYIFLVLSGFQQ